MANNYALVEREALERLIKHLDEAAVAANDARKLALGQAEGFSDHNNHSEYWAGAAFAYGVTIGCMGRLRDHLSQAAGLAAVALNDGGQALLHTMCQKAGDS